MVDYIGIRKVKCLHGIAKIKAEEMGLDPEDLVIVKTSEVTVEKIVGDPVNYLLKRANKESILY